MRLELHENITGVTIQINSHCKVTPSHFAMNQGHYKMTLQSNCNDPGPLQINSL